MTIGHTFVGFVNILGLVLMRDTYLLGNWKMWGSSDACHELLAQLRFGLAERPLIPQLRLAVFPPAPYLMLTQQQLKGTAVDFGGQTLSEFACGAYTGEVAAEMLVDVGCRYVLVGHSERRKLFAENDVKIAAKFWRAIEMALVPVLCIGESLAEWQAGETFDVLQQQLQSVLAASSREVGEFIVAYEPVWAIGSGQTAEPELVGRVHHFIRKWLKQHLGMAVDVPLLYGGSVKAQNLAALLAVPNVDGVLVGGASLQAAEFIHMVDIAAKLAH